MTKSKNRFLYLALLSFLGIIAVYAVAFFLSMDMPQLFKIVFSILAGVALIFVASTMQRRRENQK